MRRVAALTILIALGMAAGAAAPPITVPVPSPAPQTQASENEEARQLYTAGRYYSTRRTAEGLRQGIERLERAVELDPEFGLAYSELADCYSLLNWFVEPPPPEAWQKAKLALEGCMGRRTDRQLLLQENFRRGAAR